MKNKDFINKVVRADALELLPKLESDSVDVVLTDPPYFLDKMDDNWDYNVVSKLTSYCKTIKSLPPGMKFDREQRIKFYNWYLEVSKDAVILDPFIGSGTTAVAARRLGKNYIGIDVNEKYVEIAEKRLDELEKRPELFKEGEKLQLELRVV